MAQAGVTFERGGITFHGSTGQARAGTAGSQPVAAEIPLGFSMREDSIVDIQISDTDPKKIQIKRGTVLCKDVDSSWTDLLAPTDFAD